MNAFECLEAYQQAVGFDGWAERVCYGTSGAGSLCYRHEVTGVNYPTSQDARPAWRDGDDWFVLPDGWTWDEGAFWFAYTGEDGQECELMVRVVMGAWIFEDAAYDTAPEAFRASERYLKGGE